MLLGQLGLHRMVDCLPLQSSNSAPESKTNYTPALKSAPHGMRAQDFLLYLSSKFQPLVLHAALETISGDPSASKADALKVKWNDSLNSAVHNTFGDELRPIFAAELGRRPLSQ